MAWETSHWTTNAIPDLSGRTYLVTEPTSGIGFEAAQVLANRRAAVLMVGRNARHLAGAQARIKASASVPTVLHAYQADIASLDQAHVVADQIAERYSAINGLVLNTDTLQSPETETDDGYEIHMGVNFLAPALLAGRLLGSMPNVSASSIVFIGSRGEKYAKGKIDLKEQGSSWANTYSLSKKALHGFALALKSELAAHDYRIRSVVVEPGTTKAEIFDKPGVLPRLLGGIARRPAHVGARPILRAVTDPTVSSGSYLGPNLRGYPTQKRPTKEVRQLAFQRRMWQIARSEIEVVFPWERR